jgi:hypothetical protein
MGGCDPFATGTVGASVTGTVVNTTGLGIDSAQVTLLRDGSTVRQVRSRSDGSYSIEDVDSGTYSLQYSAVGYASRTVETSVDADESLQAAVGTDTLIGPASVSGRVLDSQTGDGVGGATVLFSVRPDAETRAVALKAVLNRASASAQQLVTSPDFITTTDETGRYEIAGMPTGEAARTVRDSGSLDETTRDIDIEEGSNELDPATLPDEVEEGSFRIVLNWGQAPEDLDAHLKGPGSSGERYHTYWNDQSAGNAEHNQDATDGTGPETITISDIGGRDGLYRYSVQNYSDRTPSGATGIASSAAEVEIYDSDGLVKSYTAPPTGSEEGSAWRVFEILATDGTLSIDDGGGETLGYRPADSLLSEGEGKGTITIEQGSAFSRSITPLNASTYGGKSVESFYNYRNAEANPPNSTLKDDAISHLFFYDGPGGLSLVVIHGKTDGDARFDFSGINDLDEYVEVKDGEPGDTFASTYTDWQWASDKTDGGAWAGILDAAGELTITPTFDGGTNRWVLVQPDPNGSGLQKLPENGSLDLGEPITITRGGSSD